MGCFTANNKSILTAKIDGAFYCAQAECTHMRGYLPSGTLNDGLVSCPNHNMQFDVKTGKLVKNPLAWDLSISDLKTYPTRVDGSDVFVDV